MVRTVGLEPTTFGSGNHCSIQLSYARAVPDAIAQGECKRKNLVASIPAQLPRHTQE